MPFQWVGYDDWLIYKFVRNRDWNWISWVKYHEIVYDGQVYLEQILNASFMSSFDRFSGNMMSPFKNSSGNPFDGQFKGIKPHKYERDFVA